jgi:hypothetical protein
MSWARAVAIATLVTVAGTACSSITSARVQPESVHVAPGLRPIAVVHAQVTSAYFMFLGFPGNVNLDRVVNRMLIRAAKELGADKVVDIKVSISPDNWRRKMLGWRSAEASGVAVVIEGPARSESGPTASE